LSGAQLGAQLLSLRFPPLRAATGAAMSSPLTPSKLPSLPPGHPSLHSLLLTLPPWFLLLSLIFGGCCSNAYFLERTTSIQPSCGTLLTFLHFLVTALVSLPGQLSLDSGWPRVRQPKVPLRRWAVQVALYYASSLLNNSAFAYAVPMPVHIIFRSGGLVVNMLTGWAVKRRR
jgi:UDP-xylose/UDP-N-acetylglucosamine transporter B4